MFAVWWLVSLIAYLVTGKVWTGGLWVESSARAWSALGCGSVLGSAATAAYVFVARHWKLAAMAGDDVRGVRCSIGQLPIHVVRPTLATDFPDKSEIKFPDPENDKQGKIDPNWMDEWFRKYERDFPEHAALMRAAGRVLNKNPQLPAAAKKTFKGEPKSYWGDDQNAHGSMTLVAHSWISGSVGVWKSKNGFSYTGIQHAIDNQNIELIDPNYKLDTFDPLIGLICFIHDIGKIETFKQIKEKESGELIWVQTRPRSDTVGAALMARMDEFWALPFDDRMIITLTVGNYRKPQTMPLRRDLEKPNKAVAISDRTMAMLKLVTEVDDEVSLIEENKEQKPGSEVDPKDKEAVARTRLWDCFRDLMNESFRIHHENHRFRVGQKNAMPEGVVITLKEDVLRAAIMEKLASKRGRGEETKPDYSNDNLTERLLAVLDEHECLVKDVAGVKVEAKNAVWKVEFHGKDKQKSGEPIASWPYAIMIRPEKQLPRLCQDQDASSTPQVVGPAKVERMLEVRAPRPAGPVDALQQGALEDEEGIPILGEGTRARRQQTDRTRGNTEARIAVPTPQGARSGDRNVQTPEELVVPTKPARQPPKVSQTVGGNPGDSQPGGNGAVVAKSGVSNVVAIGPKKPVGKDDAREEKVHSNEEGGKTGNSRNQEFADDVGLEVISSAVLSSSSFLDEVDPPAPQPIEERHSNGEGQESVQNAEGIEGDEAEDLSGGFAEDRPANDEAAQATHNMLEAVRKKLRDNALKTVPKTEVIQPSVQPTRPAPEDIQQGTQVAEGANNPKFTEEIVLLTRSLSKKLEWLAYLTQQKKIAPDVGEDGRLAYSLDAIKAHDPKISEWLDTEVLSKLMMAKRVGPSVPVCFMRTGSSVSLLVVNQKSVDQVLKRR